MNSSIYVYVLLARVYIRFAHLNSFIDFDSIFLNFLIFLNFSNYFFPVNVIEFLRRAQRKHEYNCIILQHKVACYTKEAKLFKIQH